MATLEVDEKGYCYKLVKGVVYPPGMNEEMILQMQKSLNLRDGDIAIATYPKCGTTWMQQIVLTLLHGGDKSKVPDPMLQAPWLEMVVSTKAEGSTRNLGGDPRSIEELLAWDGSTSYGPGPPGRRVFKTHAPVCLAPWTGGAASLSKSRAKVIVVARNPKDACISMFHHSKDVPAFKYSGDFDHFVSSLFLPGKVESGCFWEWHSAWRTVSESTPDIFWITYEEMKSDLALSVRRIGAFLDIAVSDDTVKQVAGASTFEAMKAGFEDLNNKRDELGQAVKRNHIRQGSSGSWMKMLNGNLLAKFDAHHAARVSALDFRFEFDFGESSAKEGADEQAQKKLRTG